MKFSDLKIGDCFSSKTIYADCKFVVMDTVYGEHRKNAMDVEFFIPYRFFPDDMVEYIGKAKITIINDNGWPTK